MLVLRLPDGDVLLLLQDGRAFRIRPDGLTVLADPPETTQRNVGRPVDRIKRPAGPP